MEVPPPRSQYTATLFGGISAEHDPKFLISGQRLQDFINLVPRTFTQVRVKDLGTRLGSHRRGRDWGDRKYRSPVNIAQSRQVVPGSPRIPSPWPANADVCPAVTYSRPHGPFLISWPAGPWQLRDEKRGVQKTRGRSWPRPWCSYPMA